MTTIPCNEGITLAMKGILWPLREYLGLKGSSLAMMGVSWPVRSTLAMKGVP